MTSPPTHTSTTSASTNPCSFDFPFDLEREIFEIAGSHSPATARSLMLASRTNAEWVRPIQNKNYNDAIRLKNCGRGIQKVLLYRKRLPKEKLQEVDSSFCDVENHPSWEYSYLKHSQLGVVMRLIASLSSDRIPDDIEEKYRFRSRARVLYEQWIDSLPALNRPLDPQWANRNGEHDRVRRWRCNLQRSFLTPSRPAEDEHMPAMDIIFTSMEKYDKMCFDYLMYSKIGKVVRLISQLDADKIPREEEFHFKKRASALMNKWLKLVWDQAYVTSDDANGNSEGDASDDKESTNQIQTKM